MLSKTLFILAKYGNKLIAHKNEWRYGIYICNGTLLSHKKKKKMLFVAAWMDLEMITLSELSQKKKNTVWLQLTRSVMSDCLRPHELHYPRPPCLSPTPGVHSNSCPSSPWCHPAVSSSVVPFSSCPQSLPASGSFPMSQLFAWGDQSIGVSASASVLPMNTQD